jgi:hypothetical protein
MTSLFGGLGLYLGAIILLSGWITGNCTQNSTDALLAAGLSGLIATMVGGWLVVWRHPSPLALLTLAPAALLHLRQIAHASGATYEFAILGRSFCRQIHGLPYGFSGSEPLLIGLWLAHLIVVVIVGTVLLGRYIETQRR